MNTTGSWQKIRWIGLACLLVAFLLGMAAIPAVRVSAGVGNPGDQNTILQQTDYPPGGLPTVTVGGYPANSTPTVQTGDSATATATWDPNLPTLTLTLTPTTPPNVFRTEDAEMGGSQVTPPASETPAPAATTTPTVTPTGTATTRPVVKPVQSDQEGFKMNWGLFWVGFAIPVVAACGVVLYLLDRRPNLFRRRK